MDVCLEKEIMAVSEVRKHGPAGCLRSRKTTTENHIRCLKVEQDWTGLDASVVLAALSLHILSSTCGV